MELKVHIDNTIRIVCGLNKDTTVQDVIIALAHSLKQTGRFYLIERFVHLNDKTVDNTDSVNSSYNSGINGANKIKKRLYRMPRIMAPSERPIEVINNYVTFLYDNEYVEFHLIKSKIHLNPNESPAKNSQLIAEELMEQLNRLTHISQSKRIETSVYSTLFDDSLIETESPDSINSISSSSSISTTNSGYVSDEYRLNSNNNNNNSNQSFWLNANSLLNDINEQQKHLEIQSKKLDKLLRKIEKYEILSLNEAEAIQDKLNNLEYINCINSERIVELGKDTNEHVLRKEHELNEFLLAQKDYYERKLKECTSNLENKLAQLKNLEIEYEKLKLNSCNNQESMISSFYREKENESIRQYDLNKARLEYLMLSSTNLDRNLEEKRTLIEMLEKENEILDMEISTEKRAVSTSSEENESTCSSESLSFFLNNINNTNNDNSINDDDYTNKKISSGISVISSCQTGTTFTVRERKSKNFKLSKQAPHGLEPMEYTFDDIHYF